jgi:hypothetical protein
MFLLGATTAEAGKLALLSVLIVMCLSFALQAERFLFLEQRHGFQPNQAQI